MKHTPITAAPVDPAAAYLEAKYGPDYRALLGLVDHPYAETDDSTFWDFFGDLSGDPAPDLTAHNRATVGMSGEAS